MVYLRKIDSKFFAHKEFDQCESLFRNIMLDREMCHLLTQLPADERNSLIVYSRSFFPMWYRTGVVCTECLLIFGTYSFGFIFGSYIFHGFNTLWKLQKQAIPLHSSLRKGYMRYSINKYNEQWSSPPLSRVQKVKTY